MSGSISTTSVLGLPLLEYEREHFLPLLSGIVAAPPNERAQAVGHLNAHALYLFRKNKIFADALRSFDYVFCDGYGAAFAVMAETGKWPCRRTFADFIHGFLRELERNGRSVYIVGYLSEQLEKIELAIKEHFPKLDLRGFHHGFFDISTEFNAMLESVRRAQADVVLVGMGMPRQEIVAGRLVKELAGCTVMTCGAGLLHLAGLEKRGPRLFTDHGLEWAWRTMRDPKRLMLRSIRSNWSLLLLLVRILFLKFVVHSARFRLKIHANPRHAGKYRGRGAGDGGVRKLEKISRKKPTEIKVEHQGIIPFKGQPPVDFSSEIR